MKVFEIKFYEWFNIAVLASFMTVYYGWGGQTFAANDASNYFLPVSFWKMEKKNRMSFIFGL